MPKPVLKAKGPISIPFDSHRDAHQTPVRTVEQYRPLSKFRRLRPKLAVFAFSFLFIGLALSSQLVGSIFGIQTQGGSAVNLSRILDDNFNLSLAGFVEGSRLKSTATSGAPLVVESSGFIENLNSDLLDGRHGTYYLGATTLDSLGSSSFLRSDTSDSYTSGTLTMDSGTTLDINGNLTIADTIINLDGGSTTIQTTSGSLSLKGSRLEFEGTRSSSDAEFFRDLAEGGSANNGIFLFGYNSAAAGARYGRLWVTTTGVFRVDPSISNRLSLDTGAQNYLTAFEGSSSGENREFRIYGWNTALAAPAYGFLQYDDSSDRFRLGVSSGDLELDDDVFISGDVGIGIGAVGPGYNLQVEGSIQGDEYYSGDGNQGADATPDGLTFKDGLYISGSISGFDNYDYWIAQDDDGTTYNITSVDTLQFNEGNGIDIDFSAEDILDFGLTTLSSNWDIGDGMEIHADVIRARDAAGLGLYDQADTDGIFIKDGGNVGIGINNPDGTLHIHTATAGAIAAHPNADDLIVENSTSGGISILTPATSYGGIYWGNPGTDQAASMRMKWSINLFEFSVAGSMQFNVLTTRYFVFNESGLDVDFRVESSGSTHMLFVDGGNDEILIDASNTLTTADGTLHVHTATAGAISAGGAADDLVIENSGDAGISILTPATDSGLIAFQSTAGVKGQIKYNHSDDSMQLGADGALQVYITSTLIDMNVGSTDTDFRVESPGNGNMFFVDAGANKVGIGDGTPTETLTVVDDFVGYVGSFYNDGDLDTHQGVFIQACLDNNPTAACNFLEFRDGNGTVLGAIEGDGLGGVTNASDGGDYAELFTGNKANFARGDLIALGGQDQVVPAGPGTKLIGAYSSTPITLGNWHDGWENDSNVVPVGLLGQLKVKVSTEKGPIQKGDPLAVSPSQPGVGVKATEPGRILGFALESTPSNQPSSSITLLLAYVSPSWYDPEVLVDEGGDLAQEVSDPPEADEGGTEKILANEIEAEVGVFQKVTVMLIATFKKIVAETAELASAVINTLKVGSLTVGEADAPAGITIYDQVTGEPYCISISDGEWLQEPGECK